MLDPLFNHAGVVHCWRLDDDERLIGLGGDNLAFIAGDSIYTWGGVHLAWWFGDHVRNHKGEVALFGGSTGKMGVVKPVMRPNAIPPLEPVAPSRPNLSMKPLKPLRMVAWTTTVPF